MLFSISVTACGGGGGTTPNTTTLDTTPPTVSSVSPVHNDTGVKWNAQITATFSEPMTASTITSSTFTVSGLTGTVIYSGNTATFTPSANMTSSTAYTAYITTGVKDAAGNSMSNNYALTFTSCVPAYVVQNLCVRDYIDPNLYSTLVDYQRAIGQQNAACIAAQVDYQRALAAADAACRG